MITAGATIALYNEGAVIPRETCMYATFNEDQAYTRIVNGVNNKIFQEHVSL